MGQRHQIFVKIANPSKHFYDATEKAKAEKQFGKGEYAILSYHNGWLYGRSALETALRLLNFGKQFTKEQKTSKDAWDGHNSPIAVKGMMNRFDSVDKLTQAIAFVLNFRPTKNNNRNEAGFDSNFYIGETDEGINDNYTLGDNNDGITIIDLIENKYCFMNINTYGNEDELNYSASDLKPFEPVNAHEYVKAYYGESIETCNPYYFERGKGKTQQEVIEILIKENAKLHTKFKGFGLLSKSEVKGMFPKVKLPRVKKLVK